MTDHEKARMKRLENRVERLTTQVRRLLAIAGSETPHRQNMNPYDLSSLPHAKYKRK